MCRETHMWYASHDDMTEKLFDQYSGMLSPSEKEHVMRMHTYELKRGALLSRALVRTIIARCMGISWRFHYICSYYNS